MIANAFNYGMFEKIGIKRKIESYTVAQRQSVEANKKLLMLLKISPPIQSFMYPSVVHSSDLECKLQLLQL